MIEEKNIQQIDRKITGEEAAKILQEERQKNVEMCQMEIREILDRHKCQLTAEVILRQGQVIPNVVIVPDLDSEKI